VVSDPRLKIDAEIVRGTADGYFMPGNGQTEWFQDHSHGPEMVVVPAGSFLMGSPPDELEREHFLSGVESPQHRVTIAKAFAVGRHAITRAQYATFIGLSGYRPHGPVYIQKGNIDVFDADASWRNPGFRQQDNHPVVCVNWDDAIAYVTWLNIETGKTYRLPTEAEREYFTRAGTTTPYWWGTAITPDQANYRGDLVYRGGGTAGVYRQATVPVESFAANPWGLFNVHGNIEEFCLDDWHDTYHAAPDDGSAWMDEGDTKRRWDLRMGTQRGGSWYNHPSCLRSAQRGLGSPEYRCDRNGFRLVRTL
jgi:formylglycine-generating enzyme required for sulfatase activity